MNFSIHIFDFFPFGVCVYTLISRSVGRLEFSP